MKNGDFIQMGKNAFFRKISKKVQSIKETQRQKKNLSDCPAPVDQASKNRGGGEGDKSCFPVPQD